MTKIANVDHSWTLFLDRDGVINERVMGGYVLSFRDFKFKSGVLENAADLFAKFGRVVVVTNQQCVAKKLISEQELSNLHQEMVIEFEKNGAKIDKVYAALEAKGMPPYMRKPNTLMAEMAKMDFPQIEFTKSIMVGDTDSDIRFGKQLGMKTVLVQTIESVRETPDLCLGQLNELIDYL